MIVSHRSEMKLTALLCSRASATFKRRDYSGATGAARGGGADAVRGRGQSNYAPPARRRAGRRRAHAQRGRAAAIGACAEGRAPQGPVSGRGGKGGAGRAGSAMGLFGKTPEKPPKELVSAGGTASGGGSRGAGPGGGAGRCRGSGGSGAEPQGCDSIPRPRGQRPLPERLCPVVLLCGTGAECTERRARGCGQRRWLRWALRFGASGCVGGKRAKVRPFTAGVQLTLALSHFEVNEWSLKIRKEMRVIDRQIRGASFWLFFCVSLPSLS